jgi:hemoglobin-like flavoprotein
MQKCTNLKCTLRYGVKESYYPTAGKALLATIKHVMADEYTAEIEGAWLAAYDTLASVIKNAAYSSKTATSEMAVLQA